MDKVFTDMRAPSTLGTFLRGFTFGHVRQLDAVAARALIGLAGEVPGMLGGADATAMLDIDDTVKAVFLPRSRAPSTGTPWGHAIVEQVIADLKAGPLAHLPSGRFQGQSRLVQGDEGLMSATQ